MIQEKLQFNDGSKWDEVYNTDGIRDICFQLIDKWDEEVRLVPKYKEQAMEGIEEGLEELDSFDTVYFWGYLRYFHMYVELESQLRDAMGMAKHAGDDGYCVPEFVIDPYEKVMYLYPFETRKVSI